MFGKQRHEFDDTYNDVVLTRYPKDSRVAIHSAKSKTVDNTTIIQTPMSGPSINDIKGIPELKKRLIVVQERHEGDSNSHLQITQCNIVAWILDSSATDE